MTGKISMILVALAVLSLGILATETSAQPTVITACGAITATGSYRLGNNLVDPGGSCLRVTASRVTIDLDGFVIGGPFVIGIFAPGVSGLTVRNGTISASAFGIQASDGLVVDRVTFSGNENGGVASGNLAIVRDSVFIGAGADRGSAISLSSGLVTGNVIVGGGSAAIQIGTGTVSGNLLNGQGPGGPGVNGLKMTGGGTVLNNTVQNYTDHGLEIMCPSNVLGNTATGNGVNLVLDGDPSTCNVEHTLAP